MEMVEENSIGEGTYFRKYTNTFVLIQKIKLHSIVTTILIGVFVYLVYKSWIVALLLILLGVLQIFMAIRITIEIFGSSIKKDLCFFKFQLYNYYSLIKIVNFKIVDYETGRGDGFTVTSFDIGFFVEGKRFTLLTFGSRAARDKLKEILVSHFS